MLVRSYLKYERQKQVSESRWLEGLARTLVNMNYEKLLAARVLFVRRPIFIKKSFSWPLGSHSSYFWRKPLVEPWQLGKYESHSISDCWSNVNDWERKRAFEQWTKRTTSNNMHTAHSCSLAHCFWAFCLVLVPHSRQLLCIFYDHYQHNKDTTYVVLFRDESW